MFFNTKAVKVETVVIPGASMPIRFKVLSVVFIILFLLAQEEGMQLFKTYHAALAGLVLLAVFSIISLWPNSSRADRVDRSMSGANWSDRIEFDKRDQG